MNKYNAYYYALFAQILFGFGNILVKYSMTFVDYVFLLFIREIFTFLILLIILIFNK